MSTIFFDAYTRIGPRRGNHSHHPWSLQHLLDEMNHCSISGALVASTGQLQYDCMYENQRLVETLSAYDHLFPIWNVMPHWSGDFPHPDELRASMREHDIRAITLHPNTNAWSVRSRTSRPLLEMIAREGCLTILNLPGEISPLDAEYLAEEFPDLPLLLRGMAWSQAHQILPLVRQYPSIHLAFDAFHVNRGIEFLTALGHSNQLVFCSNAPQMSAGAQRAFIDWADIDEPTRNNIAAGNLTRLLRGLRPPRERINENEDELMSACRAGKPLPCLVLDMHAHVLDEGLHAGDAAYPMHEGGPSGLVQLGNRLGIDGIGIMSWNGTVGVHAQEGNTCITSALDRAPEYFWGLGTFDVIHNTPQDNQATMARLFADPRFVGLKPYPSYGVPYDDPRFDSWWEFGQAQHLYAGFHPVDWYQRKEFASVCERYPELTVVAYHVGASYEIADTAISLAKEFPNLMMEPTYTTVCAGVIDYLVEHAGVDRLMFGSDQPMRDPRQQLGWIVFSRLSLAQKRQVLGGNARHLLLRNGQVQRQPLDQMSLRAKLLVEDTGNKTPIQ